MVAGRLFIRKPRRFSIRDVAATDPSTNARREFLRSTEFLIRMMPELDRVRRQAGEWDRYGRRVANEAAGDVRPPFGHESLWDSTKRILVEVVEGTDARHAGIRDRIRRAGLGSPVLFPDLCLWLAGEFQISITVTKRLVAAAWIGVAAAGGDWNALAS